MVEADQAHVPVGGAEGVWTPEHLLHHEELCTVEDDPGDVTEEEDHDNADEDGGQVCFTVSTLVSLHVSEPADIIPQSETFAFKTNLTSLSR